MGAELSSSTGEKDLGVSVDSKLLQSKGVGVLPRKFLGFIGEAWILGVALQTVAKLENTQREVTQLVLKPAVPEIGVVRGVEEGGGWKSWIAYTSLGSAGGYRRHLWLPWSRRLCVGAAKSLCPSLNRTTHGIVWLRPFINFGTF